MELRTLIPHSLGGPQTNVYNLLLGGEGTARDVGFQMKNRRPMWKWILENKPEKIMEIGLGHGFNALCMISLAGDCEYYCFDELVKKHETKKAYELISKLENAHFFVGDTRETLPDNVKGLPKMDLIFIDGGHSYEVVKNDWNYSKRLMHDETTVWFHDYIGKIKKVVDSIDSHDVEVVSPAIGPSFAVVRGH